MHVSSKLEKVTIVLNNIIFSGDTEYERICDRTPEGGEEFPSADYSCCIKNARATSDDERVTATRKGRHCRQHKM